jgi:hypothetical protein
VGRGADQSGVVEPSDAERARTLLETHTHGVLATMSTPDYAPFASPIPYIVDGAGDVVTVLTNLNRHVMHALREPRASLCVGDRLTLVGHLDPVPGFVQYDLEERYVAAHPDAAGKVLALDCSWLRLVTDRASFDERWLERDDWRTATPDPLRNDAHEVLTELSTLADELLALTRVRAGRPLATSAAAVGVDRYGIDVTVAEPVGRSHTRIAFPEPVVDIDDAFHSLIFMVRALPDEV